MTRYDLLKMNASVLKIFLNNKIDIHDAAKLEMFEEYSRMQMAGEKFCYIISHLSDKYGVSPRTITTVARRMREEVRI